MTIIEGLQQHVLHSVALGLHKLSWDLANELKTKYKRFVRKYKVFKSQTHSQGLTELYIVNLLASYAYNAHQCKIIFIVQVKHYNMSLTSITEILATITQHHHFPAF